LGPPGRVQAMPPHRTNHAFADKAAVVPAHGRGRLRPAARAVDRSGASGGETAAANASETRRLSCAGLAQQLAQIIHAHDAPSASWPLKQCSHRGPTDSRRGCKQRVVKASVCVRGAGARRPRRGGQAVSGRSCARSASRHAPRGASWTGRAPLAPAGALRRAAAARPSTAACTASP